VLGAPTMRIEGGETVVVAAVQGRSRDDAETVA
jgi:hypothetical protein